MTDEQRKRIHDITYSTQDRMELAERIVELEDENAELREQVTWLKSEWESERDYADQMEANEKQAVGENAKLRKFATLAWQLLTRNEPNFVWQDMVEGASELGIEEEA